MVRITVYGGAGEIGGNKILLEDRDTKVWFDFGQPFNMLEEYFVDYLKPRDRFGLRDYLHFDLIPWVEGLYSEDALCDTDRKYRPPEFDAIFLSHMHFDHVEHIKFTDPKIPVHLGETADLIRESWEVTTKSADFGEHKYVRFRTGSKIKVGSLEVEPIHVDHSVPGAYGFIIHTSDGCLVYSGDLRLHGPRADMTGEFVSRAVKEKPVAMICEGTRVASKDKREDLSEREVRDRIDKLVSGSRRLAVVSFYPKDIDRIRTYRDVAKSTGRKFVVSPKIAHLLETLKADKGLVVPDPLRDPSMMVYVRSNMSKLGPHERRYLDMLGRSDHVVDSAGVKQGQDRLIFHTEFSQLPELIDIEPSSGSKFIRSMSEPFEEDDIQDKVLRKWVKSFGMSFHQAHASGHANREEIMDMVRKIRPRLVIPVHTEEPELFRKSGLTVRCPRARECIAL